MLLRKGFFTEFTPATGQVSAFAPLPLSPGNIKTVVKIIHIRSTNMQYRSEHPSLGVLSYPVSNAIGAQYYINVINRQARKQGEGVRGVRLHNPKACWVHFLEIQLYLIGL